jgi:A/G-specific adenine glycosylase
VPDSPSVPIEARDAVLAWFATNGRRLAFRRTTDPYAILVSEAMSQQTQAARAADHWERFMARFPTIESLAAATPADVLRQWQGLGYNRRAVALWRAARVIRDEHGARVPESIEALEALPGVGPYTARAVAAIAFGRPVGAVDVNVRRVLGRLATSDPAGLSDRDVQNIADDAVPPDQPAAWTHALMDIGATLCRPRAPRCDECPARPWCRFAADQPFAEAPAGRRPPTRPRLPFPSTSRWLRGRLVALLTDAPDGAWVELPQSLGEHGADAIAAAAAALERDGLFDVRDTSARLRS